MRFYALMSSRLPRETLELFLTEETAEAELREILEDEPEWVNVLRVVPIELDGREESANQAVVRLDRRCGECSPLVQNPVATGTQRRQVTSWGLALSAEATAGTKRAHSTSCCALHRATELPRRQGFHADSEVGCNHFPPTGCERRSDDAKFILGTG